MRFSRLEYWSEQPFPSPGDLPNPGIEPRSPALQADSLPTEPQGKPIKIRYYIIKLLEENIGKIFSDIIPTDIFLPQSPKAIEIKINK